MSKIIMVTGGNRGIGLGLVKLLSRSHTTIFTARSSQKGEEVLRSLGENAQNAFLAVTDVMDEKTVQEAARRIKEKYGRVDVLINNAGILPNYHVPALEETSENLQKAFEVNVVGVLNVCRAIAPLLPAGGKILNISSGMGQLSEMDKGAVAYRVSKTALNALSRVLHHELKDRRITVCPISPGWVRTDMGGPNANLSVEESAGHIVKMAMDDSLPNGKFLRAGKIIDW